MSDIDEPYNEDDYEDEKYYPDQGMYKKYFKFDEQAWDAWGQWLYSAMKDIVDSSPNVWYTPVNITGFPIKKFPVNSYFSNTGKDDKSYQYLGNNYEGTAIWKKKYFVKDVIGQEYVAHLQSNIQHFLSQPSYYRGIFDILN